jgi:tetratricopeptide (TPR) repeat protein
MGNTNSTLDEARECRAENPNRALALANHHIDAHPDDAHGYFSRYLTFQRLGRLGEALTDCSRALTLRPQASTYLCRGDLHRLMGNQHLALADFNQAHAMDREKWLTSFGPHMRADTLARLGRMGEALADANLIDDDHWMPAHDGLPGGNKQQFIAEIKRRVAVATGKG